MKKIISVFCAVFITVCLMLPVDAIGGGRVTVGEVSAKPGEDVEVLILLDKNPGMITLFLSVAYDVSVMELTSVENGDIFPEGTAEFGNNLKAVPFNMMWEDGLAEENNTQTGVAATLLFHVREDAGDGEYEIAVTVDEASVFDVDLNAVKCSAQNGVLTVGKGAQTAKGLNSKTLTAVIISAALLAVVAVAAVCFHKVSTKKKTKQEGDPD